MHARSHVSPHGVLGILGPLLIAAQSLDQPSAMPSVEHSVQEPPICQGWGDAGSIEWREGQWLRFKNKDDECRPSPTHVKQRRGLLASADQMLHRVLRSVGRERECSFLHGKNLFQAAHAQQAVACGYVHPVMPAPGPVQQPIAVRERRRADEEG